MMRSRLLKLLAGPELGLTITLLFAALYTWPLFTFTRPSATFCFMFVVWGVHVAFIALTSFASNRLAELEQTGNVGASRKE